MLHSQLPLVCSVFLFSYVISISGRILRLQPGNQYEVCDGESAILTCPTANHLPVVRASRYGRMQASSQCLQRGISYGYDQGSIGCGFDVTDHLKNRCNQQTNCTISVPNDFHGIEPCGDVIALYLEIRYDCFQDMTGRPTNYTITTITGYNQHSGSADATVNIILFGESGNDLQLSLDPHRTIYRQPGYYGQNKQDQYVFTNVTSVGVLKCADFQVLNGSKPWYLSSFTIQSTESASFAVNSFYFTDSEHWPATRGCGTSYRIRVIADSAPPTDSSAWVYVTLIGEEGNSSQLILGQGENRYYDGQRYPAVYPNRQSPSDHRYDKTVWITLGYSSVPSVFDNSYSFNNLPSIGKVTCVHIRRDDWRARNQESNVNWFLRSIEVRSEAGNSFINVTTWIPSITQLPNGIVACGHGSTLCLTDLQASCPLPQLLVGLKALTKLQLVEKIVEMNMLHQCPSMQNFFNCTTSFLKINSQCPEDQQIEKADRQQLQMIASLVDYVCRSNLDVINCHKKCLLQVADDGNLTVLHAVTEYCREHLSADKTTSRLWPPLCQSHEFMNCLTEAVAIHCNQMIADVVSKFYGISSNQFCDETTKPACPYDFTLSDAGCHKLVKSRYGWDAAATECSQVSPRGHLVFITNEAEQHQIDKVIDKTSGVDCSEDTRAYWIGGRRQPGTPFRWYYNATNVADSICYENWYSSYPTRSDSQQCTFVQKDRSGYKWLHQDCSSYATCSVCEIDL